MYKRAINVMSRSDRKWLFWF